MPIFYVYQFKHTHDIDIEFSVIVISSHVNQRENMKLTVKPNKNGIC